MTRLADCRTSEEVLAEQLQDPEVRALWERSAVAREVAIFLIRYRVEHDLTQTQLAALLGMKQPQLARLEDGEHNPSVETLMRLATALNFRLEIAPHKVLLQAS